MKNTSCTIGIFGIALILLISGCSAGSNFVDGVAAISGQGGKIAREDAFDKTVEMANKLNKDQPSTKWETAFEYEGSDFISFLDKDRLLVGTVESGSYLGVPKHGDIKLFNANTGEQIWSAERDGIGSGHYVLLVTDPLIVIVGRNDDVTKFLAYDPLNGSKKWKHRVNAPDQFIVAEAMERIISLSASDGGRKIEALDIKTGNIIWSQKLSSDSFSRDIPDVLIQGEESFFVAGKKIIRIAEKDGSIIWSKNHPILESKDRAVTYTPEGILVYNSGSVALLREKDGAARWVSSLQEYVIKCATVLNKKAYRVTAAKSGPGKDSFDTIQALSVKDGKVLWSKPIKGKVASPLCMDKDVLTFTTDNAIYGLEAKTGEQRFRNPFSKAFISGGPSSAKVLKRPDIIRFGSGKLYLVREMSGIRAYAFPSGRELWEQLNFDYQNRVYSADRLYEVMARDLPEKQFQQAAGSGAGPSPVFSSSSPSPFMQSAQRQYESMRQRTAAVLRNRGATKGERHSALQTRAIGASLMESHMKVGMAMGRMQAAGDLLVAVFGLQGAIQNAITNVAIQGAISRKYLELRILMGLQQACLQGKYYLWPFYDEGRGVTIVDLDTGKRNDLVFSPRVQPLEMLGVDLPSFCIGPDGKTLIMVGVGMNPAKYEEYVKWKYRMPKPSVLAYDVSMFDFMQKSLTQQRAEERAVMAKKKAEAMAKETQTFYDKSKIHSAAQAGNLKMVKSMLDSGVDPNTKHPHDETGPLMFAIIGGNPDIVRLLVEKGANVNEKDKGGKSILFWAKHFKNEEIIKILKDAGAR